MAANSFSFCAAGVRADIEGLPPYVFKNFNFRETIKFLFGAWLSFRVILGRTALLPGRILGRLLETFENFCSALLRRSIVKFDRTFHKL